jgi:hypothetical protein
MAEMERRYWPDNNWSGLTLGGGAQILSGTDANGVDWSVIGMNNNGAYVRETINLMHSLSEIKFTRAIMGGGSLKMSIDGAVLHTIEGPAAWEFSPSIKALPGWRDIRIEADGGSDASLGEIKIIGYDEINCLFRKPIPFRQEVTPTTHGILRGFSVFQQTGKGHATSKFSLYFNSPNAYLDFMANAYKVHAIKDELGIFYRGVIVVEDVTMISEDCFYVDCVFNAPYQAGVGW